MQSQSIAFVALPGFSHLSLSSAIQPLRGANRIKGRQLYRWAVISPDAGPVTASNGIKLVPDGVLDSCCRHNAVFVLASVQTPDFDNRKLAAFLHRHDSRRCVIGAIGTASLQLARLGLLDGYRTTVHWEARECFREEFPHIELHDSLYEIDGTRFSCAGGIAPLDMMLHLIALTHGTNVATEISGVLLHEHARSPDAHQSMARHLALTRESPAFAQATRIMEQHIEQPLPIPAVAVLSGLSQRQLERLCKRHSGMTAAKYYQNLRLKSARRLLAGTTKSVTEIGLASGFASTSHFCAAYRKHFGRAPGDDRDVISPARATDFPRAIERLAIYTQEYRVR